MSGEGRKDHTIHDAEEAVRGLESMAKADPRRPRYHFHARAGWMNDPNGPIFHRGWYHMFYQTNPFGELCWNVENVRVCWGHARSRDMLHWEHLPIAIWPSIEQGEDHCWSGGCVIRDDGVPMIFYTSIGQTHPSKDGAEQWAALGGADLVTWTKYRANPIVAGKVFGGRRLLEWRDPFVLREGGTWYMVTGGHCEGGRGCISMFKSPDLEHWEFAGFPIEGEEENWECPALFKLGDRWVLTYNPHAPVRYYTGRMDFEHCRFEPLKHGQFDYGRFIGLYASTVMPLPDGRTIFWGWMFSDKKGRGWNGCHAAPRELNMLPDGRVAQRPARELESLRCEPQQESGIVADGKSRRYATPGGCAEAILSVGRAGASRFGVRLHGREGAAGDITWSKDGLNVMGDAVPLAEMDNLPPRELRIYLDRALVEVFVNDRVSVSRWIEAESIEALELFAEGGSVDWKDIRVWRVSTDHV